MICIVAFMLLGSFLWFALKCLVFFKLILIKKSFQDPLLRRKGNSLLFSFLSPPLPPFLGRRGVGPAQPRRPPALFVAGHWNCSSERIGNRSGRAHDVVHAHTREHEELGATGLCRQRRDLYYFLSSLYFMVFTRSTFRDPRHARSRCVVPV